MLQIGAAGVFSGDPKWVAWEGSVEVTKVLAWGRGMFHKENVRDGVGGDIRLATMPRLESDSPKIDPVLGWVFPTFY